MSSIFAFALFVVGMGGLILILCGVQHIPEHFVQLMWAFPAGYGARIGFNDITRF